MNSTKEATFRIFDRIAFGSCNKIGLQSSWPLIQSFNVDKLLLLGDNFYADHTRQPGTSADIAQQYYLWKQNTDWSDLVLSIGGLNNVYATFDDHDYGIDNGDKNYEHRNVSQGLFWDFFAGTTNAAPIRTRETDVRKSGVFSSRLVKVSGSEFSYKVILLDTRSNKDKKGTPNGDFLGTEQWEWLEREMLDTYSVDYSKADNEGCNPLDSSLSHSAPTSHPCSYYRRRRPDLILLGSSIQVLPEGKLVEESWAEFPAARKRLLDLVAKATTVNTSMTSYDTSEDCVGIDMCVTTRNRENRNNGSMRVDSSNASSNLVRSAVHHTHVLLLSGDVHYAEILQAQCKYQNEVPYYDRSPHTTGSKTIGGPPRLLKLWEITSSGLTHSFSQRTRKSKTPPNSDDARGERHHDSAKENRTKVPAIRATSRGWLADMLYSLYQAIYTTHYREHHNADHFQGINFGLIDLLLPSSNESSNRDGDTNSITDAMPFMLRIQIVNNAGATVIERNISFKSDSDVESTNDIIGAVCDPFWGEVPMWRHLLARFVMAFFIFVFFVIPALAVVWLLVASIFNIGYSAVQTRRRRLRMKAKAK